TYKGVSVTSYPLRIDVYKFGINKFKDHAEQKDWKVCVGRNIEYEANASSDCHGWSWEMPDGVLNAWNISSNTKSGTNMKIPYSDLARASNSWFGDTYGNVRVKCYDSDGNYLTNNSYSFESANKSKKVKVFFPPNVNVDGNTTFTASKPPCWFKFWRQQDSNGVYAVDELKDFTFNPSLTAYGQASYQVISWGWDEILLEVGQAAGGTHYPVPPGLTINGIEFGGAIGIDCCREVVVHEKKHNTYSKAIQEGSPDIDPVNSVDPRLPAYIPSTNLGDLLPDSEEAAFGCSTSNKDTFDLRISKNQAYAEYGDGEYAVMVEAKDKKGNASADWSRGGKQW
ncbi:MAG: hypothetical protein LBC74_04195, partial [Planctomycetaceae bacterium]|nr:hypothetical protein [Planctomycetaceae bacterium]